MVGIVPGGGAVRQRQMSDISTGLPGRLVRGARSSAGERGYVRGRFVTRVRQATGRAETDESERKTEEVIRRGASTGGGVGTPVRVRLRVKRRDPLPGLLVQRSVVHCVLRPWRQT